MNIDEASSSESTPKTPGVTVGESSVRPLEPKRPASDREIAGVFGRESSVVGCHFVSKVRAWKSRDGKRLVPDGHEDAATLFASAEGLKFDEGQLAGLENVSDVMARVDHVVAGEGEVLELKTGEEFGDEDATMRAKVRCTGATPVDGGEDLEFIAVGRDDSYPEDGSDPNNTFAKFTPTADLKMSIRNPALFGQIKVGDVFHLDFFRVALVAFLFFLVAFSTLAGTDPLPQVREIYVMSGAPSNGTNAIQTITLGGTPTGGTFTLSYKGKTTSAITWTATDATLVSRIDTALEALATIGTGGVTTTAGTVSSGIGTITVTFTGNNAKLLIPAMTVSSSLTGTSPTLACAITTAGVTADARSAGIGALLVDNTTPGLYQNAGTALNPSWTVVPTAADVLLASAPVFAHGATASGSDSFDLSGSTGTFKTSTGVNTIGGATVFAANKGVTVTAGTSAFDLSGGTGVTKTTTGLFTVSGGGVLSTTTRSGPGAISVVKGTTKVTTTGVADALTLADGTDGQIVTVIHDVDGGSAVLTPTTKTGFTAVTFTNAGESVTLQFVTTRGWIILAINGAVAA